MTPAYQIVLHDPPALGDCLRASVASVLDLAPEDVPHFVQIGTDRYGDTDTDGVAWHRELRTFLADRGLDVLWCPVDELADYLPWSVLDDCMLQGPSPRGDFSHIVVGRPDGTITHDPHPSQDGLAGPVTHVVLFSALAEEKTA